MRSVSYYPNIGISLRRGAARVKTGDYEAARGSSVVVHILVFVRSCASLEPRSVASRFGFSRLFELSTPFSLLAAGSSCASSQEFMQQGRAAHSFDRSRGSDRFSELHAAPKPKRKANPTLGPNLV